MPRTLVTSALPYANGPIHFGHVIGAYLPADVYVRTLRMQGEEVLYVCGTDEHGVAITIGAEERGEPYAEYVARWRGEIERTFAALGIEFDHWSGTSTSPHHAELAQRFFLNLERNGYLDRRETEQLYSAASGRFLADRYVVGTCPRCGHDPARGDECPRCGAWYDALELGDPRSKLDGSALERRATTHWYLDLPKLRDEHLGAWVRDHEWKSNVKAFLEGLLDDVPARAITRDMDWGVPLPEETPGYEPGKVLYVWFDAPIGYVSITREWAEARGEPEAWERWWRSPDTRLVHFIGKDNIPFHCLVFPAMLWGQREDWILPWQVPANEFYNLEGRKFSTSEGWTIPLDDFLERYDAEVARFYLLTSAPETADSDWQWEGFRDCANALLADTIGNLVTRVLRFCAKHWDGALPPLDPAHAEELERILLEDCGEHGDPGEHVRAFRFRRAAEQLVQNARVANVFVDRVAPWALRKTDPARAGTALRIAAEWIGLLARWGAPFLPGKARALWAMLGQAGSPEAAGWPAPVAPGAWRGLADGPLGEVAGLFTKVDEAQVEAELAALRARASGG